MEPAGCTFKISAKSARQTPELWNGTVVSGIVVSDKLLQRHLRQLVHMLVVHVPVKIKLASELLAAVLALPELIVLARFVLLLQLTCDV